MNVQVYYQKTNLKETHDNPLLLAASIGTIHDAVYEKTHDRDVLKNLDALISKAVLHLPDDTKQSHLAVVYAKRPEKDEQNPRIRHVYTIDNLHECPGWTEYIMTHFSTTIEDALMEMFVPCTYNSAKIPEPQEMYAMIKASEKNKDGFVANIGVPAKDGFNAPSRRFYFPKEIPDVAVGLAKVSLIRNTTYGFMNGRMIHTSELPADIVLKALKQISNHLASAPDMVMEVISREDGSSLTLVYDTPAPRNRDVLPLLVMFHNDTDGKNELYNLSSNLHPSEDDVRVMGFTANMISIFAGDRKCLKSVKVGEIISKDLFGMSIKEVVSSLRSAECIYAKKFLESRYSEIHEELSWAYPKILMKGIENGLLQMVQLDDGVAKMIRVSNPDKLFTTIQSTEDRLELAQGMSDFNAIANEEIIRLGRRNKIKIDNP